MSDVQLIFNCVDVQCIDIGVACGDLMTGNDLSTAIYISLFTDRRANSDDAIPAGTDPRGWWGDAIAGERMGSRLWLLERSRNVAETLRLAEDYAKEALKWLVTDGVVKKFNISAIAVGGCNKTLLLTVLVYKPDGKSLSWKYRYAWDLSQVLDCEGDFPVPPIKPLPVYRGTYPIADCDGNVQGYGYRITDVIDPAATLAVRNCGDFLCWVYPAAGPGHSANLSDCGASLGFAIDNPLQRYQGTYPIADCNGVIQGYGYRTTDFIDPAANIAVRNCGEFVCWVYSTAGPGHTANLSDCGTSLGFGIDNPLPRYRGTYPIADCDGNVQGYGYRITDVIDPAATLAVRNCGDFLCWVYPAAGPGHSANLSDCGASLGFAINLN